MTPSQLSALLLELLALPHETEWVEWKHNNSNPELIAERLSALANSAALHGRETAYLIWGIEAHQGIPGGESHQAVRSRRPRPGPKLCAVLGLIQVDGKLMGTAPPHHPAKGVVPQGTGKQGFAATEGMRILVDDSAALLVPGDHSWHPAISA